VLREEIRRLLVESICSTREMGYGEDAERIAAAVRRDGLRGYDPRSGRGLAGRDFS
jgi:hypothetical protein